MLSLKQIVLIAIKSRFRIIPLFLKPFDLNNLLINNSKRNWKVSVDTATDYEQKLYQSILIHMPYVYLEGFSQLALSVKKISPKSIVSATGWSENERMKVIAAEVRQNEGGLIGLQHGGGPYGVGESILADLEVNNTSIFLTWGWGDGIKAHPFYSFKLSRLLDRVKPHFSNNKVLYIGTSGSKYFPDELGVPSGGDFKQGYIEWQHIFLKALPQNVRKNVIMRIYPDDARFGWNQEKEVISLDLDIPIDLDDYYSSISSASLIISDNLYTTFFEAVAANIPVFMFLNEDLWKINKDASLLFKKMKEVGMYRTTPESAAEQVSIISLNVRGWWEGKEVVQVRNKIIDKYARNRANIADLFVDTIINRN